MNATQRELILQRWNVIQHELLPELKNEVGPLTPKLERGHPHPGMGAHRGIHGDDVVWRGASAL
jgi:hypothetical protein